MRQIRVSTAKRRVKVSACNSCSRIHTVLLIRFDACSVADMSSTCSATALQKRLRQGLMIMPQPRKKPKLTAPPITETGSTCRQSHRFPEGSVPKGCQDQRREVVAVLSMINPQQCKEVHRVFESGSFITRHGPRPDFLAQRLQEYCLAGTQTPYITHRQDSLRLSSHSRDADECGQKSPVSSWSASVANLCHTVGCRAHYCSLQTSLLRAGDIQNPLLCCRPSSQKGHACLLHA